MYELIDTRDFGHESERPHIIVERWGSQLRRVYAFRECDESYAKEILERMNALGDPERFLHNAA